MELSSLVTGLRTLARRSGRLADNTRWYLFGSAARGAAAPDDVDVLIVYSHDDLERAHELARFVEAHGPVPLDLVLLSAQEEDQSRFSTATSAVLVWP